MILIRFFSLCSLLLILAACGLPETARLDLDETAGGGITPERAVEKFLDDMNLALADPELSESDVRRAWAERLASHFAPSERIYQRTALRDMLDRFSGGLDRFAPNERFLLALQYERAALITTELPNALVGVVGGRIAMSWYNADGSLRRERSRDLLEALGRSENGFPVIFVNGRWYLSEQ